MQIWVDADACPKTIKDILFRAAIRTRTALILVSNHALSIPPSTFITKIQVLAGYDVADNKIIENIQTNDLVITGDIPLAAAVVDKGAIALNPRGELYTPANIKARFTSYGCGVTPAAPGCFNADDLSNSLVFVKRVIAESYARTVRDDDGNVKN